MGLDALLVFFSLPAAFWLRFNVFPGIPSVPLEHYVLAAVFLAPAHVLIYAFFGIYESVRKKRLYQDLGRIFWANTLGFVLFQMVLFLLRGVHFARGALLIYFLLVNILTGGKRVFVRKRLHHFRRLGYNQKHVVLVGSGLLARRYIKELKRTPELGLTISGYIADGEGDVSLRYLGTFEQMEQILDKKKPDEVVAAL